jgi:chromosome segregation ATPase
MNLEAKTRGRKLLYLVFVLVISLLILGTYLIVKEKISELSCAVERENLEAEEEKIKSKIDQLCEAGKEDLKGQIEELENRVRDLEDCKNEKEDLKIYLISVLIASPLILGTYLLCRRNHRRTLIMLARTRIMLEKCEDEKEKLKAENENLKIQINKLKEKIRILEENKGGKSYTAEKEYYKYWIYETLKPKEMTYLPESKTIVKQE